MSTKIARLASLSTYAIDTPAGELPQRLVMGAFEQDGIKHYYVRQAYEEGGIIYNTGDEVWEGIEKGISDDVVRRQVQWEVNQKFLQNQMEAGIPRMEYVSDDFAEILARYNGQSYDEVAAEWAAAGMRSTDGSRIRFRHLEVLYLRDNAAHFGYELVDNIWVKK